MFDDLAEQAESALDALLLAARSEDAASVPFLRVQPPARRDGYRINLRQHSQRLDMTIGVLLRLEGKLSNCRKMVEDQRRQNLFANIPISALPDDVLTEVFRLVDPGDQCDQGDDEYGHFALTLSHVSRHWRALATSQSELWIRFCCTSFALGHTSAKDIFQRSKARSFALHITPPVSSLGHSFFSSVLLGRLRELNIEHPDPLVYIPSLADQAHTPEPLCSFESLQTLILDGSSVFSCMIPRLGFPELKRLTTKRVMLNGDIALVAPKLECLEIIDLHVDNQMLGGYVNSLITHSPLLEILRVQGVSCDGTSWDADFYWPAARVPTHLHHLRQIELDDIPVWALRSLVKYVAAPRLERFHLEFSAGENENFNDYSDNIRQGLPSMIPNLHAISRVQLRCTPFITTFLLPTFLPPYPNDDGCVPSVPLQLVIKFPYEVEEDVEDLDNTAELLSAASGSRLRGSQMYLDVNILRSSEWDGSRLERAGCTVIDWGSTY